MASAVSAGGQGEVVGTIVMEEGAFVGTQCNGGYSFSLAPAEAVSAEAAGGSSRKIGTRRGAGRTVVHRGRDCVVWSLQAIGSAGR